jgi:hypothetical protein
MAQRCCAWSRGTPWFRHERKGAPGQGCVGKMPVSAIAKRIAM